MYYGHAHCRNQERYPYILLYALCEGSQARGRPNRKWIDNIKEDSCDLVITLYEKLHNLLKKRLLEIHCSLCGLPACNVVTEALSQVILFYFRKITTDDKYCRNNYKMHRSSYRASELLSIQQQLLQHWCVCVRLPANVCHTTNGQTLRHVLHRSCMLASCSSFETDAAACDMSNEHRSQHPGLHQSQLQRYSRQFTNVWYHLNMINSINTRKTI